jgi:hypothetical protein
MIPMSAMTQVNAADQVIVAIASMGQKCARSRARSAVSAVMEKIADL